MNSFFLIFSPASVFLLVSLLLSPPVMTFRVRAPRAQIRAHAAAHVPLYNDTLRRGHTQLETNKQTKKKNTETNKEREKKTFAWPDFSILFVLARLEEECVASFFLTVLFYGNPITNSSKGAPVVILLLFFVCSAVQHFSS
jgi:hypothetical protein